MEEVIVNSTRSQIEKLKKSIIWDDICRELRSWQFGFELEKKSIVDDAERTNPSTASVLLHLGDINGREKAIDYVMSILDVFLGILEDQKEAKDERQD